jgi:hypothetical protein
LAEIANILPGLLLAVNENLFARRARGAEPKNQKAAR